MQNSFYQMVLPCAAAILNTVVLLVRIGQRRPVLHTVAKCAAFAIFTTAILYYGIVPTQPTHRFADVELRFVAGILEMGWWILAAATTVSIVQTYYAVGMRLRQHRFVLDVVATLMYLGSAMGIVTDVLDIPVKGVLATSGALAIVLGLALQSTLSDLFSGLLINATSPYRVGDAVALDDSTEGEVVEITWRATHMMKANRDLIVVPNSIIAKSRIVNRSTPGGPHAIVARFEAPSEIRPSTVIQALELGIDTCVGIASSPKASVATTLVGFEYTTYEVTFIPNGERTATEILNRFYDAAHRHLEAVSIPDRLPSDDDDPERSTVPQRLIDAIGVFGMLPRAQRNRLASALVRREVAPGHVILAAGEVSRAITIIAYGIVSAATPEQARSASEMIRFAPREYFAESGPIAGVASLVSFTAQTYAIVYELPASAIKSLLSEHSDVAHALAGRLVARERKGQALMQPSRESHAEHGGLASWLSRCIQALHHPHLTKV